MFGNFGSIGQASIERSSFDLKSTNIENSQDHNEALVKFRNAQRTMDYQAQFRKSGYIDTSRTKDIQSLLNSVSSQSFKSKSQYLRSNHV